MRFNHFHDQLLLSSSSDSRVILNNIESLSSEPFGHLDEEDEDDDQQERSEPIGPLQDLPTLIFKTWHFVNTRNEKSRKK